MKESFNTDEIRRQLHNESVMAQIEDAKTKVDKVAKDTETSVNSLVNTEDFDPGASPSTADQNPSESISRTDHKQNSNTPTEAVRETYTPAKNPKLAQAEKTGKVVEKDGVG